MKRKITLAIATLMLLFMNVFTAFGQTNYEKVTSTPASWEGEYLLVYENGETAYAWSGVDAASSYVSYAISGNTISASDAITITIASMDGGYSIKVNGGTNDGKYIYGQSGSNTIKFGSSPELNTLEFDSDNVKITSYTSVMRFNSASNNLRFRYFKSTSYSNQQPVQLYKKNGGGQQSVATPTFSPAAGTYYEAQNVTISCTTAGVTIHYTLDGSNPTENSATYSTPIAISETTTVKAMAVKAGMSNSNVASATYTIQAAPTVITIAEARALAVNEFALVQGVVTFIDGKNVYIQDETAGIDLYLNSAVNTLSLGDKVQAYGKRSNYNGLLELANINPNDASQFSVISTGNTLPLAEKTIAEINADAAGNNMLQSTRVKVVNAIIGTINTSNNTPLTQGENTINIYKVPALDNIEAGDAVDVIGVIGCYNNPQLRVALASDVTIHETPMQTVATPTFTPAAGTYNEAQNVTIACATNGATIYYTLDGTDPISPTGGPQGSIYSNPIVISETTTVKAVGVKQGMYDSEIATALYTIETGPELITIAEARALANNEYGLVQGIVTFIDGRNVYVQDATAGIDLYLNNNTVPSGLALGDMVQAYGKKTVFNGLIELTAINGGIADQFSIISTGNTLPLAVKTIAEILADHNGNKILQSTRVQIVDATVGTINTSSNTPITQDDNTLNIYKMPVVEGLLEGDIATVIGVVGCYNAVQLRVANAADVTFTHPVVETVATPTFTPAAGTYTEAINVTIACATENASIYYTTDGTDPAVNPTGINGTLYTAPIALSENTTVKAFAMKAGMNDSDIATAVYEFQDPTPPAQETAYTLITNNNALIAGDKYIVVGIKGETYKALGKQASNNRPSVDVTPVDNVITLTPATTNDGGVFELTLGQADGKWTLYDAVNEGYLYAASSSANQLRVQANNDANGQWTIDIDANGVATIKAQGTNTRNWLRLNTSGSPFSCYASGQLDVYLYKAGEVPTPPTPTYYNVTVASGITNGTISVDPTSALEGATITVTADANAGYELATLNYTYAGVATPIDITETMQFVMPAADVVVNGTFVELAHVANPTFTPTTGTYYEAQTVTIACATEGATIYYTLDGTDPTLNSAVYAEAFTVNSTTTVKAMAVKEGMNNSSITSATYTIILPITIAEARALENNQYALVQGIVTFMDGRNIYVQDETAGIDLYLNNNTVPTALALGDMVQAYGKKTIFNGLVELTSINGGLANQFQIMSSGNPLPLAVKTIAEINADAAGNNMLQSTRVQIVEAIIGAINTNNNTPITQDENTLNIYKMPVVEGLEEGDIVTVIGVIGCYNNPQLRVASAADVTYEHPIYPTLVANPTSLSGFNYVYEEGPSVIKTFALSASNLVGAAHVYPSDNFEISSIGGELFTPETDIQISGATTFNNIHIYVRLKANLEIGTYAESITMGSEGAQTVSVAVSGAVTEPEPPVVPSDYTRVSDLSQLTNGSKVVFAARFDENANEYYAMTAQASGKPTGVLFTSAISETGAETLPEELADEEDTYYWTVSVDGANYTFTNANGDVLGYTSSTNFSTGGDNTAWAITFQTSEATAMVPNYSGYVVNNVNNAVRAIALNNNHNFGPYHTQNIASENYNFFLDMFATVGGGTLTCATPTFTPEAGTYFEEQEVTIACSTADATIYYTLDGSDPTANSSVYSEPITIASSMTVKAIAMKEGYENSAIATAEYTIIIGAVTIFEQDWEGEMNGWTFVTVEGSKPWNISQYQGNHYAYANGYNGGVNEQWCISPAFNLNIYSNATLTFRNAKNYTGPDVELFFSNDYDGTDPTTATWTALAFEMSTGSYAWTESGTIDLANFTGENCYIGFKYTSTEEQAAAWEIDDIVLMGFTTEPYLTVTPTALSGFTHIIGQGPSAAQTFVLTAGNITPAPGGTVSVIELLVDSPFYISFDGQDYSYGLFIEDVANLEPTTVYVRMDGTEVGQYTANVNIATTSGNEATVSLSGTVTEEPTPGEGWNRIYALSDLHDGDQVILASRYDATIGNGYYAMEAGVSGKPDGVLFTSVNDGGVESLPAEIADNADTYLWNVTLNGDIITLVNAAGDTLGYSSSTNFAGNVNTEWNIALETSSENALIPNYTGFVITNGTTTNRGIAKNASNKFGAYATSNISSPDYNFYLDLFVSGGSVTPTVATPVFSIASGTYYEAIEVEITCSTEDATIYYTLDGTDPTAQSEVYTEAIEIEESTTIKAIAMKEGYDNSAIAVANYVIMANIEIIISQDWEGEMNDWTFVTVEGNKPWTIGTYAGNKYANANGYGDDVDNEQWCISPAFNLSNRTTHNVTLTFRNAMKFTGPDLELYFTNDYDGQDPTTADWQPLSFTMSPGNYTWTESGEISLNAFDGQQCYIGFRYISTIAEGAAAWEIDDIMVVADMGTDPYLSATPNALSGLTHVAGQGPSEAQTFVLTGGNLPTGFLTVTLYNSDFEISFDGEIYTSASITIPVYEPTLEPTTVYVRLNGEEIGDYEGSIIIDVDDDITTTVSVSGTVTADGIDETLASSVNVWNNSNELIIVNNSDNELQMVVYNIVGQPVLSETVATGNNVIRHDLVDGVYIVRIANGKEMTGIKVSVRR